MKILAIRFTHNTAACRKYYSVLGLDTSGSNEGDPWQELGTEGGIFALHAVEKGMGEKPPFELSMESTEPLEDIQKRLHKAGYEPGRITHEDFGRALHIIDPEGFQIQVNEGQG